MSEGGPGDAPRERVAELERRIRLIEADEDESVCGRMPLLRGEREYGTFGFLTSMPLSLGSQRYGVEQIDFCKPSFGPKGSRIILIFYLINMLGFAAGRPAQQAKARASQNR